MTAIRRCAILALAAVAWAPQFSSAQSSSGESAKERTFWPESPLVVPVYPRLAQAARITGDVKIRIGIHRDGTVTSAEVVSGPPMLQQAALESAQKSKFQCSPDCTDDVTAFVFTYTFGTREGNCCCDTLRLRSAKCLYLWRCGPWRTIAGQPPTIGASINRIIILADPMCIETTEGSNGVNTRH